MVELTASLALVINPLVLSRAPLRMEGSDAVVLVNRGWIELGHDLNVLPEPPLPEGCIEIRGVLDTPPGAPPITWGEAARPGSHWGKRWAYLELDYYPQKYFKQLRITPYLCGESRSIL